MPRTSTDIPETVLRIALASGLGPRTFDALARYFDNFDELVGATLSELMHVEGVGRKRAEAIRRELDEADIEAERQQMAAHDVNLIMRDDEDYPVLLSRIPDPPVALWVRGELREEDQLAVAIVGSRRCTQYGREQAGRFGTMLAQCGLTIVSGGARGIDGEAHRAAIRAQGRTIVVCGSGLGHVYPPEHADLFDRIVNDARGALLSEYPMSAQPLAQHFPRRNRIISGLSLGVLVVEAARGSGALITAKLAAEEHHREVMAVPGRVDSPASMGCLRAVREGWAALVLDHADVLSQLESVVRPLLEGAITSVYESQNQSASNDGELLAHTNLTDAQKRIVEALNQAAGPVSIDDLVVSAQVGIEQVLAELTILQIRKIVSRRDATVELRNAT